MTIIKKCKEHGKQFKTYNYCPYCGDKLEVEEINKIYTLQELECNEDKIIERMKCEARGTSWTTIGLSGNVGVKLANKDITPMKLQEILKTHIIKGIGKKSVETIKKFTQEDFDKFDQCYEDLAQERTWAWGLAKWSYSSAGGGCTIYEYEKMKTRLKKLYDKKVG